MKFYKITLTFLMITSLSLTGCAGFRANKLQPVSVNDLKSSSSQKTKIYSRWEFAGQPSNDKVNVMIAALHKKYFDDVIAISECCQVVEGPTEATIIVNGKIFDENTKGAVLPALITGASLYTIPSWVTSHVHISAEAKNGNMIKNYDLKDSMTMVQWLPMIFALPFTGNPVNVEKKMTENVYKNLLINLKNDGMLNK